MALVLPETPRISQAAPHAPAPEASRAHLFQANLVAAFEQSLVSMTCRLRHLAETAEEKVRPPQPQRAPVLPSLSGLQSAGPARRAGAPAHLTPLLFLPRTLSCWTYGKPSTS